MAEAPTRERPRPLPAFLLVARREMRVRLRSRVFIGGTGVMVVLVVVGIVGASVIGGQTTAARVGFIGASRPLEQAFIAAAAALRQPVAVSDVSDEAAGKADVSDGSLDVLVTGSATSPTVVVDQSAPPLAQAALERAVVVARLVAAGVPPSALTSAMSGAQVPIQVLHPKNPQFTGDRLVGLSVAILLFFTLGLYGSQVAQGVVEEKATRIMEILLATVRPAHLLAGKVVGIGLVAMLQLAIVAGVALISLALTDVVTPPALEPMAILGYLGWFVLGFLIYSTGYATLAALVSRPEEVQGAIVPVAVFQIGSYLLAYLALARPGNPLVTIASVLPPFAPILMPVRTTGGDVPAWEIGLALVLTIAAIAGLIRLAGRIYANSAMRIGTRVRFMDAFRG